MILRAGAEFEWGLVFMSRFVSIVLGISLLGALLSKSPEALGQIEALPRLVAPTRADGDAFGFSVAISGNTAVIGAWRDDVGANIDQGSATVFRWNGSAWVFETTLVAADGASNDYFGTSVAVAGDIIIIGASGDDIGINADQGSAYAFQRIDGVWQQRQRLVASDGAAFDSFGCSVAVYGDLAVIGAETDDVGANANQGSAYIFVQPGTTWSEQSRLTASAGSANDLFGGSVGVSGELVVVGARGDDVGAAANEGSAFIFVRSGSTWSQQAMLNAGDGNANDFFGDSVAISGDTVAVGAFNDDIGTNSIQGTVTVFVRSGSSWIQQASLLDVNGAAGDMFGKAVSLSGDTLVVGASSDDMQNHEDNGSVSIFVRSGATWLHQAKFFYRQTGAAFGACVAVSGDKVLVSAPAGDSTKGFAVGYRRVGSTWNAPHLFFGEEGTDSSDQFGASVAVGNQLVAIGVTHDDEFGQADGGSVYIFEKSPGEISPFSWDDYSVGLITPNDAAAGDNFGFRVSISEGTVLASTANKSVGGAPQRGAAYVFERGANGWEQRGPALLASDGAATDNFGISTALRGDVAVIGAYGKDTGGVLNHGAAYVFERSGELFTQTAKLVLPALVAGDWFGSAVGAERDLVAVGAYNKQIGANASQGAAYLFVRDGPAWKLDAGLVASDGAPGDCFGISLALDGETLAVGAFNKSINGAAGRGAVYIFARTSSGWAQTARIIAPDGAAGDAFGWRVDLSGGKLAIGAPNRDTAGRSNSGAVYVFASASGLAQGPWVEVQRIVRSLPGADDSLGGAVAISGSAVIAGMSGTDFTFGVTNYINAGGGTASGYLELFVHFCSERYK